MPEVKYTVYMHVSPIGKKYIGITCQPAHLRWRSGRGYSKNIYFWRAIQKYGWESFLHLVLFSDLNKNDAEQKEIELISALQTNIKTHGYNLESGGRTAGRASAETCRKMSVSSTGKKHSEATKRKISEHGKGIKKSPEARQKMSQWQRGENNNRYGIVPDHAKAVQQITNEGLALRTFPSMTHAQRETGISRKSIQKVCEHQLKITGGYGWRYA
jgi:group I intron endonuclease